MGSCNGWPQFNKRMNNRDLMILLNLNGPPKSGKDTLCDGLCKYINHSDIEVVHMEFKEPLFDVAIRTAGVSHKLWNALYERAYKENPCPYLMVNGRQVSPRDWMIHCSEDIMKPIFGKDVFGKIFAEKLRKLKSETPRDKKLVVVVSDGGFIEESLPVVETVGKDNYFLIRIHREKSGGGEYDFAGDSRRYLYSKEFPSELRPQDIDILNKEADVGGTVRLISNYIEKITGDLLHV